jgi:hypothetical protein
MSDTGIRAKFEELAEEAYGGDATRFFVRCAAPHEDEYKAADVQAAWRVGKEMYKAGAASSLEPQHPSCTICGKPMKLERSFRCECGSSSGLSEPSLEATPPQSLKDQALKAIQRTGACTPDMEGAEDLCDGCRYEWEKALVGRVANFAQTFASSALAARTQEIVAHIEEITGPTGGWLDSPKHLKAWIERQYGSTK